MRTLRPSRLTLIAVVLLLAGPGRALAATCAELGKQLDDMVASGETTGRRLSELEDKVDAECIKIGPKGEWISYASLRAAGVSITADKTFMTFNAGSLSDRRSGALQTPTPHPGAAFDLAWVADVGFARGDGATLLLVQGGVRLNVKPSSSAKVHPFAQVLAGVEHCGVCQYSSFAMQPGGGITYRVSPRMRVFVEVDYRIVPSSENGLGIGGGVTFPILK